MTDRQQLIVNNVDTVKQLILDAERWIWAHPQTGYTEWQAHDYLAEKYEALGYTLVKAGNIPGFYTDVETGKPGPKVAIFGELDARYWQNHYISRDKMVAKVFFEYFPTPKVIH